MNYTKAEELMAMIPNSTRNLISKKFPNLNQTVFEEQLTECLKFLYLVAKHPSLRGTFIPVTKEIDEIWHSLILETSFYAELCKKLPGSKFIHHASLPFKDYKDQDNSEKFVGEVTNWLGKYVEEFGPMSETQYKYWYFIQGVKKTLGLSLSELNSYALS